MGKERHFILGGQRNGNELAGNSKEVYEYIVEKENWYQHPDMLLTRGHASSSTRAFGCGFVISGGTTNEVDQTTEIHYYDIPSQTWSVVGHLPKAANTPVCDFYIPPPGAAGSSYYHCASPFGFFFTAEL
jgi:hypothetical protein